MIEAIEVVGVVCAYVGFLFLIARFSERYACMRKLVEVSIGLTARRDAVAGPLGSRTSRSLSMSASLVLFVI